MANEGSLRGFDVGSSRIQTIISELIRRVLQRSSRGNKVFEPGRLLASIALIVVLCCSTAEARQLHVFLLPDDADNKLGDHAMVDAMNFSAKIESSVDHRTLKFYRMQEETLSSNGIRRLIRQSAIQPNDAILLYFSGHGAYDPRSGQHYLALRNSRDSLLRDDLLQELRRKNAALTVVITDACFSMMPRPNLPPAVAAPITDITKPLYRRLFFETNGFLDVNGCSRDEVAITHRKAFDGSVYTHALLQVLDEEDENRDPTFRWKRLLDKVSERTAQSFRALYPSGLDVPLGRRSFRQFTQTQSVLINTLSIGPPVGPANGNLPVNPGQQLNLVNPILPNPAVEGNTFRSDMLGATFEKANGQLRLVSVDEQAPLKKLRRNGDTKLWFLEPGDQLMTLGGRKVDCANCLSDALRAVGPTTFLEVVSPRDGLAYQFAVDLPKGGLQPNPQPVPGRPPVNAVPRGRFGAHTVDSNGHGAHVTGVVPNSAATRMIGPDGRYWFLEAGDRVIKVNGTPILGQADFVQSVNDSSTQMTLSVISGRNGQVYEFTVILDK